MANIQAADENRRAMAASAEERRRIQEEIQKLTAARLGVLIANNLHEREIPTDTHVYRTWVSNRILYEKVNRELLLDAWQVATDPYIPTDSTTFSYSGGDLLGDDGKFYRYNSTHYHGIGSSSRVPKHHKLGDIYAGISPNPLPKLGLIARFALKHGISPDELRLQDDS